MGNGMDFSGPVFVSSGFVLLLWMIIRPLRALSMLNWDWILLRYYDEPWEVLMGLL